VYTVRRTPPVYIWAGPFLSPLVTASSRPSEWPSFDSTSFFLVSAADGRRLRRPNPSRPSSFVDCWFLWLLVRSSPAGLLLRSCPSMAAEGQYPFYLLLRTSISGDLFWLGSYSEEFVGCFR
jgi:hypothetical protein